jgi:hypothetical protein
MSYESDCNDYAIHGNPERDHWDYELNAEYDRHDGLRADFNDEFGWDDAPSCPNCGGPTDCYDCVKCVQSRLCSRLAQVVAIAQGWLDYPVNDDIPF